MSEQPARIESLVADAHRAESKRDWAGALSHWQTVQAMFPGHPAGYAGAGATLQRLGRLDDADAVLAPAVERFPSDAPVLVEYARVAHRRSDWPEALRRWDQVAARAPANADAISGAGVALQILGRLDEADARLAAGRARHPDNVPIAVEYARVAHRRRDWSEALSRWKHVMQRFPASAEGPAGAAVALEHLNFLDELERLLETAVQQFPSHATLAIDYARVAQRRQDWSEATRRWEAARARFPDNPTIVEGIGSGRFQAQVQALDRQAESGAADAKPAHAASSEPASPDRDLMMQFESFGSGCEFGLVQRRFGAEPLGLLRWGAIPPLALAKALDARFEGLGNPADVRLFEFGASKEFFFRDTKYMMEMHTFTPVQGADYDRVFTQQCRRAKYLRDKLVDDLANPNESSKIFVYKRHVGSLSDGEIFAIHTAVRQYGEHTLLCVRPADDEHPDRQVYIGADGLLIGYIDGLSPTSNAHEIKYESWLQVCRTAYRISRGTEPFRADIAAQ